MRILYSLPAPGDTLADATAGHLVRAGALVEGLEACGHEVIRLEAATASAQAAQAAVRGYRAVVKQRLPEPVWLRLRDLGRVRFSHAYARTLERAVEEFRPDAILETYTAYATAGAVVARRNGLTFAVDDVGPDFEESTEYGVGSAAMLARSRRILLGAADVVVAVSGVLRDLFVAEGVPLTRIVQVPNGVAPAFLADGLDSAGARWRHSQAIGPDAVLITYVGSFQPFHRVDLLLDAFARLAPTDASGRRIELALVGDGDARRDYEAQAEAVGIAGRVHFCGRAPHADVPAAMAAADICVVPSSNPYGNSMKAGEYLATGRAVVAPDLAPVAEVVGPAGVLVAPDDAGALADALAALADDPVRRGRLGVDGRARAATWTWHDRAAILADAIAARVADPR